MVNIEIDGIYCPKCNDLHPTLSWHEKYIDYLNENQWITNHIQTVKRFRIECSEAETQTEYQSILHANGIKKQAPFKNVLFALPKPILLII